MKKLLIGVLMMASFAVSAQGTTIAMACPTYGDVISTINNGYNSLSTNNAIYSVSKGTTRFVDKGDIVTVQMSSKNESDNKPEQMAAIMFKVNEALQGYMAVKLPGKAAEMCKITDRQSY